MTIKRSGSFILVLLLMFSSANLWAAGLGKLAVHSRLGQILDAEIEITATAAEVSTMSARVAPPAVYAKSGYEYAGVLLSLRFKMDKNSAGQPILTVSSISPITEPFINLLVELSWGSGQAYRDYVFLLDPPEVSRKMSSEIFAPETDDEAADSESQVGEPFLPELPSPSDTTEADKPEVVADEAPVPEESITEKPPTDVVVGDSSLFNIRPNTQPVSPPVTTSKMTIASKPTLVSSQREWKVRRGDTLTLIANKTKASDVSLNQMLVALQRRNRDAFVQNNMNRLVTGKVLQVPDNAASINEREAQHIFYVQAAEFNDWRQRLAGVVASSTGELAASGGRTPQTGRVVPSSGMQAGGRDRLTISKSQGVQGSQAGNMQATSEDAIARQKSLQEATSRLADLEKNVSDLEKLADAKGLTKAPLPTEVASRDSPASAKPAVSNQPVQTTPPPASSPTPVVDPVVPPPVVVAVQPPRPVAPPAPPADPGLVGSIISLAQENMLVAGGVGIALIGGILAMVFLRKRSEE